MGTAGDREMDWLGFVWEHVGQTVMVTFERAGVERHAEGLVVCHWDGSYSLGAQRCWPGREGIPVRWAVRETS